MFVKIARFDPAKAGTYAIVAVDNSASGAVYKGLAIAIVDGAPRLYATNFHAGTVEAYDGSFKPPKNLPADAFVDPRLPRGYAPFNIVPVTVMNTTELFVTYAVQDANKHDDVAGQGHGIVDTFTFDGRMLSRFAQHGQLDSPWGVALGPASFGEFAGDLLVGGRRKPGIFQHAGKRRGKPRRFHMASCASVVSSRGTLVEEFPGRFSACRSEDHSSGASSRS
jgi:uncharacterized protein (TIGR03118 family)